MSKLARMIMAMLAVLAFGAVTASSASASLLTVFLTLSGQTLLFTGEGSNPVLRGLDAGIAATINCQRVLVHGYILNNSPLVHLLGLLFENKCTQTVGSTTTECNPLHITTKPILAEIGFLKENELKTLAILLTPGDGTTVFAKFNCGSGETTVEGAIVGEIPEINKGGVNQYNKLLTELEVIFATNPAGSDQQKLTTIFLLLKELKAELKVAGFFGGKAAEEATATLKSDGQVLLDT